MLSSTIEVIQLMLAPGLMISACGLLLLAMNNKYSLVVNRIRLLNSERRELLACCSDADLSYPQNVRVESLSIQLKELIFRVKLVRNAVLFYSIAIGFFVLTSVFIGVQYILNIGTLNILITSLFLAGMLFVLIGILSACYETIKGYEIINLELKIDE